MTFVPQRATINQRVQIAAESTSALGTAVAASKRLQCFDFTMGIGADITNYAPTGHKYDAEQEEDTEWVDTTMSGKMDYNGVLYPLAGVMGGTTVAAAHASSVTAKDWVWTPPLTGSVVPQTYTIEQGDSTRAHKIAYGLFTEWGYVLTRKDFTTSGKMISQPITDNITMTATPTAIPLAPMIGKHANIYLDATSSGLGTTQLLKVLSVTYAFTGVYGPFWPINRASIGFTAHTDLKPKCTIKIKMEADSAGMAPLSYLQAGTTYWLRVDAQGPQIASDGGTGSDPIYSEFQHDMAIKFGKPGAFGDDSGVYALEWECTIVEDATWAKAQMFTVTNLIATL